MSNQRDKANPNRHLTLKSLLIFTALVAIAFGLIQVGPDAEGRPRYAQAIGWFSLFALVGGGIGFLLAGRVGFLCGVFALPIIVNFYAHATNSYQ